jgi:hypothetical protein
MAGGGKVDADLVRPSRLYSDFQEGGFLSWFQKLYPADCPLSAHAGGMQCAEFGVGNGTDGNIDGKGKLFGDSGGQGAVDFNDVPGAPCGGERGSGPDGSRKEDHSGSPASQAVDGRGFGVMFAHLHQEGMFEKAPAGAVGSPLGLATASRSLSS